MLKKINDLLAGTPMTIASGMFLAISLVLSLLDISVLADPAWISVFISGIPLLYLSIWRIIHNLASNPDIVFTQTQIFEAVWNMDSDNCHISETFT